MTRLARAYRGWTVAQLNEALGRSHARLSATSANPKLDLVARLADALDWELGSVAENIWTPDTDVGPDDARWAQTFAALDARAQAEHRAGACTDMERTARVMRERPGNLRAQLSWARELSSGRVPAARDLDEAEAFVAELRAKDGMDDAHAMQAYCLVVLNLNDFLTVD
jgi:hypothetical protein